MLNIQKILNERTWEYDYDDSEIDDIIWSEIAASPSMGDFVCYLVHNLSHAKHRAEAQSRTAATGNDADPSPIHYPQAIERIRTLAQNGNATAMFHMGKVYAFGIATERDLSAAIGWYQQATDRGDIRASCNLGWLYQSGDGVAADKEKAFRLLSAGAENGMVVALASVGVMLVTGEGCSRDIVTGLQKLEHAFDAGYLNAGNHLSDLFFAGVHVPQDVEMGHEWLLRVAQKGDARSMAILGHHLISGSRGKQDYESGMKLFASALSHGFVTAHLWLGSLYRDGHGVERDLAQAAFWYGQGAEAGDINCALALASLQTAEAAAENHLQ
ncbi:MAG: hcpD 1 [Burkholderiaceae bacterium]|nr:hcpD 1 [Burkholderiaceae bacterium]